MQVPFKKTLAMLTGPLVAVLLAAVSLQGVSAVTVISQLGSDIDGEASSDQSGFSLAMSSDGTRIVIGAIENDGSGSNAGHVRVYDWNGTTWTQVGTDIDGEAAGDGSGWSVAMSSDGTRIAIGSPFNDGSASNAGHVRVFDWNGTTWTQVGTDIDGEAAGDESGGAVAMSSDGTRIAIGAPGADSGGQNNRGRVRVFDLNGTTWRQTGTNIDGEAAFDNSGRAVAMSSNGNRIAIGASGNDGGGSEAGHVRIYDWNGTTWTQTGTDIDGEAASDSSGWSVAMSSNGTRIAIGAIGNDGSASGAGHVRIYNWNGTTWTQTGTDIDGEAAGDRSGFSVAMTSDGTRIAIGAEQNDGSGSDAGHVRIYDWNGTTWTQIGTDIDGEAAGDANGTSVAMSSAGTRIAASAIYNNGFKGQVRVFVATPTVAITYDSQGGSAVSDGDTTAPIGGSISALPTNPTRSGYTFNGWYTTASGGTQITTTSPHGQSADFTLYAQWSVIPAAAPTSTSPSTTTTTAAPASSDSPTTTTTAVREGTSRSTGSSIPATKLPATGAESDTWITVALIFLALGVLTRFRTRRLN